MSIQHAHAAVAKRKQLLNAGNFNGTSSVITADAAWANGMTGAWSVEFRTNAPTAGLDRRIICWGKSTDQDTIIGIGTGASDDAKLRIYIRSDAGGAAEIDRTSTDDFFDSSDHVIRVEWDGTDETTTYLDGNLKDTWTDTVSGTYTPNRFAIGCLRRSSNSNFFAGKIWDVKVWSDDTQTTMEERWQINEGGGTVLNNKITTNVGTASNMTWTTHS